MRDAGKSGVRLLSVPEAARLLNVGERFAWKLIAVGELASVKLGRRRLVDIEDLERFIEQRKEASR